MLALRVLFFIITFCCLCGKLGHQVKHQDSEAVTHMVQKFVGITRLDRQCRSSLVIETRLHVAQGQYARPIRCEGASFATLLSCHTLRRRGLRITSSRQNDAVHEPISLPNHCNANLPKALTRRVQLRQEWGCILFSLSAKIFQYDRNKRGSSYLHNCEPVTEDTSGHMAVPGIRRDEDTPPHVTLAKGTRLVPAHCDFSIAQNVKAECNTRIASTALNRSSKKAPDQKPHRIPLILHCLRLPHAVSPRCAEACSGCQVSRVGACCGEPGLSPVTKRLHTDASSI